VHLLWEIFNPKEKKKKGLKGAYQKGTDKPPSIIVYNISAYVKGRVVFSAKSAENLHPKPLTTLPCFPD
jgi:hypothetical protein